MSEHDADQPNGVTQVRVETLERIAGGGQVWSRLAPRCGVENPVPPWKSSLDGMCDALDRNPAVLPPLDRRREEDLLSRSVYSELPFPERQLVALAHSLIARGAIDEQELARRMQAVRRRLQADDTTTGEGQQTAHAC